jgi:hypothetical protein
VTSSADRATSWFAVDRETGSQQVVTLGHYEDEIVRHAGAWVFARRQVFPA